LAEGLQKAAQAEGEPNLFADEPDEDELILERLKQGCQRRHTALHASTLTARGALQNSWFSYQPKTSRQAQSPAGAIGTELPAATPRPQSASRPPSRAGGSSGDRPSSTAEHESSDYGSLRLMATSTILEEFVGSLHAEACSSRLTRGSPLAGNPFAVARQRRQQVDSSSNEGDLGIRSMLQRHRSDTQSSGSSACQGPQHRPATPDVRVHRLPTAEELWSPAGVGSIEERLQALLQCHSARPAAVATASVSAPPKEQQTPSNSTLQEEVVVPSAPPAPRREGQGRPAPRRSPTAAGPPAATGVSPKATGGSGLAAAPQPPVVPHRPVAAPPPTSARPLSNRGNRRSQSEKAMPARQSMGGSYGLVAGVATPRSSRPGTTRPVAGSLDFKSPPDFFASVTWQAESVVRGVDRCLVTAC